MEAYLAEYVLILSLVALDLDDLDYKFFPTVFVHSLQGSLAYAFEELVLLNLAGKPLCFKNFTDDALAVRLLLEEEDKLDSLGEFDGYGVN